MSKYVEGYTCQVLYISSKRYGKFVFSIRLIVEGHFFIVCVSHVPYSQYIIMIYPSSECHLLMVELIKRYNQDGGPPSINYI